MFVVEVCKGPLHSPPRQKVFQTHQTISRWLLVEMLAQPVSCLSQFKDAHNYVSMYPSSLSAVEGCT